MEGDRDACLAVRAAGQGRLDYEKRNANDPLWLTKEALAINELEREAWAEWEGIGRQLTTAVLAAQATEETMGPIRAYVDDQLNRAGRSLIPWIKWAITPTEKQQARVEQAKAARTRYEKAFGAITSAKVQEAERRSRLYLLSVRIARRARRENRRFDKKQAAWVADVRAAQLGDRPAWKRVSRVATKDLLDMLSKTFTRKDIQSDIHVELGETA